MSTREISAKPAPRSITIDPIINVPTRPHFPQHNSEVKPSLNFHFELSQRMANE